ncbi:hypothetical protein [Dactylosporangium sp. NPDC005555]|uniref:hypothetical protein n=1 Tax=Dactylosporangium sp. NPDC005555 TaxID=3154889 RepID=UPI0033B8414C
MSVEQLAGYGDRDFAGDLARWFPDRETARVAEDTRSVEPFLARLPQEAATALAAFDRLVRSGTMPWVVDVTEDSYGFDFAGNDCQILDSDYETELSDDDVWSVAADGGGNLYVMLTNGKIAVWFHEEEVIEAGTQFDNLDVFLYSIVRYQAARAGVLDRAAVAEELRALGQPGATAEEVGLIAYLT